MSVLILASEVRTCLGDGDATYAALLAGRTGVAPLRGVDGARINVLHGYEIPGADHGRPLRAGAWLAQCVTAALRRAGVDLAAEPARRVTAVVGTGLRELSAVEAGDTRAEDLHFAGVVRAAAPVLGEVLTIANACSAAGHALALGQDLLELGDADVVVVGGADAMTESMLAMIGRMADAPTDRIRPFDADRRGVLLGEGAAAVVLAREPSPGRRPVGRVLATGLSCDAEHETAPSADGIARAMRDAYHRAGRAPSDVDLVVAHGTGTALNDPVEAGVLRAEVGGRPLVTAVKGAIGHTSGGSALMSLDVALRCLAGGPVPPVVGLREPAPEAHGLRLVTGAPAPGRIRLAQVDAFGFGGVNAVTLVAAP
ncbi:beta-ketoacyl synthase N-terminal-like domain-containing protein [Dactylosporangium sp. NPDC000244]|uniref:beta-ketoacyl synthase N-terminal-like domain-containing protein n=1 Tax=Dactylosporangium sp. NPDC000244 TaxID=3154365 RepID=UPI00332600AA